MTWQAWLTLVVIGVTIVALVRDLVPPALAVMGAVIVLLLAKVITPAQALGGFSNPATLTVASLFLLARAVEKTSALQPAIDRALADREHGRVTLLRLLAPAASISAFLNNTPIVALLAPQVAEWAEKRGKSASAYLMPISYAVILGGVVTVIGTSTNLVVSGLMTQSGMAPIGMFEITRVGLPVAIVGLIVLVLLAPRVLPARRAARRQFEEDVREYVMRTSVLPNGPLDGRTVADAGLRHLQGVFLVQIERFGEVIAPVGPTAALRGGDVLTFAGRVDLVRDLQTLRGLRFADDEPDVAIGTGQTFFEVVVSEASALVGKTLRGADFRSRYQAAVVAIHRAGARVNEKLGTVELKAGDTLLLLSDRSFAERWRDHRDFLLVSHLGGTMPTTTRQAMLVGVIGFLVVVLAGSGVLPILQAALAGAAALVLLGVLTPQEARDSVNLDVLVVIAASLAIGAAIEQSGVASVAGKLLVAVFSPFGPIGILFACTAVTVALTAFITNNAAAALFFPVAMSAAKQLGLDPRPYAIAVAVAASMSFMTPIGYQCNAIVYGLGGYRFGDFPRLGAPLTAIVIATIVVVTPLWWTLAR